MVLCQIVLVTCNLIQELDKRNEENHSSFIMPLIKKILAIKWSYFLYPKAILLIHLIKLLAPSITLLFMS